MSNDFSMAMLDYAIRRRSLEQGALVGIRAFVTGYYDNFSDAVELPANYLRALDELFGPAAADIDVDVLLAVRNVEADINHTGGVQSDSDSSRHHVRTPAAWEHADDTYPPEELV